MLWPFGSFIAKRLSYRLQSPPPTRSEEEQLLGEMERENSFKLPPSQLWSEGQEEVPLSPLDDSNDDNLSYQGEKRRNWFILQLFRRAWKRGFSSTLFFGLSILILTPVHLIVTVLCYFFIFPIPVGNPQLI